MYTTANYPMTIRLTEEVKKGYRQIRLNIDKNGTQAVIIVGLDGWEFNRDKRDPDRWGRTSRGKQVRISMNSPLPLTIEEWRVLNRYIDAAYRSLV